MIACPQCLPPSTAMASMTAANSGKTFPQSQFNKSSLTESTTASAENPNKEVKMEWLVALGQRPVEKASLTNPHTPSLTLPQNPTEQPPALSMQDKVYS